MIPFFVGGTVVLMLGTGCFVLLFSVDIAFAADVGLMVILFFTSCWFVCCSVKIFMDVALSTSVSTKNNCMSQMITWKTEIILLYHHLHYTNILPS